MVNKARAKAKRRRLSTVERREELLRACLHLIGTRPWDEVSMADVAEAAGASKPLLYHYFATKSELYLATVEWAADELREATAPDLRLPRAERLLRSLNAHLDWIEANDLAYRAILHGGSSAHPQAHQVVEHSREEVVIRLAEAFDLSPVTPAQRLSLRGWVGFLEGACLDWLGTRSISKADLVRLLAASITTGPLRAAEASQPPPSTAERGPRGHGLS